MRTVETHEKTTNRLPLRAITPISLLALLISLTLWVLATITVRVPANSEAALLQTIMRLMSTKDLLVGANADATLHTAASPALPIPTEKRTNSGSKTLLNMLSFSSILVFQSPCCPCPREPFRGLIPSSAAVTLRLSIMLILRLANLNQSSKHSSMTYGLEWARNMRLCDSHRRRWIRLSIDLCSW